MKQIDYNGEFEYSNEVEVIYGEIPENYAIQQNYPNPFNPSTKVTFSLPEENKVVIKVFNAMGEQVKEIDRGVLSHGYFEQDFEMSNESSGMYFCQVLCTNTISGRTKSLSVKMVLMK
ncbi:MAG: T9SS type A sorting domain-containing protein [Ignavibacteriales bacterium]|nr:T9SS type A sorting domain-containing protein [Ignavibacteriales bacterium]